MLEQSGMHLGSFPETPFRLKEWTVRGSHCVLDKAPDRMLDIQVCSGHLHSCYTINLVCSSHTHKP